MDELVKDIKANGIQRPILIAPDYLVYDGARRMVAAEQLKMRYVPVNIVRTWSELTAAMTPLSDDAYPMTWPEVLDQWDRLLKPLHEVHRRVSATETLRINRANGTTNPERSYNYSGYIQDLAGVFGVPAAAIKMVRDNLRRLDRIATQYPVFHAGIHEAMAAAEPEARHLTHSRILKTVIDRVEGGRVTQAEAVDLFVKQIHVAKPNRPVFYSRRKRNTLDERAPKIPLSAVQSLADLAAQVALQASHMQNFHMTARHQRSYEEIVASLKSSHQKLYRLYRRLAITLEETQTEQPPSS